MASTVRAPAISAMVAATCAGPATGVGSVPRATTAAPTRCTHLMFVPPMSTPRADPSGRGPPLVTTMRSPDQHRYYLYRLNGKLGCAHHRVNRLIRKETETLADR